MRLTLVMVTAALLVFGCDNGDDNEKVEITYAADLQAQDSAAAEILDPTEDMATPEDVDSPEDTTSELLGFGATCVENADCQEGVCHAFGNGGLLCTVSCVESVDCPEGSEGEKCNNKGVCKP
jgi:hypothetical protein